MVTAAEINKLLAATDPLFNNIYSFSCAKHAMPGKSHRGAAVAHQDILERRGDFSRELRNTMSSWVYSKQKYNEIFNRELISRQGDTQNAVSNINSMVREKFRKGFPQGQFGELLLFNIIQHYFKAVPLLRKMPLTTNPAIERHGADAIHFRPEGGENIVFIGEAKSYVSKYKFKEAIKDAVGSILGTLDGIISELGLYVYDDFIDEGLRPIANQIKNNTLPNTKFELVAVVSYSENDKKKDGANQAEIEASIEKAVNEHLANQQAIFAHLDVNKLSRIHFVVLPFWKFEDILKEFDA